MAEETWAPVEQVAKNAEGATVALINGAWKPVTAAAKNAEGKFMALSDFAAIKATGNVVKAPEKFTPSGEKASNPLLENNPDSLLEKLSPDAVNVARRMAGRGIDEGYRGTKQMLGLGSDAETKEKTVEGEQYSKDFNAAGGGFDPARAAGNLIVTSPANAIPGGGSASMLKRMAGNAAAGGVSGAAMFTPEGESKTDQALMGAGIGVVIPPAAALAAKGARVGYHGLVEPLYEGGRDAIKGRAYLGAAGNKADEIIDLLMKRKEIVPGSKPTAGEAASPAGRAEFSALDASAGRVNPSERLARGDEQNAARIAAIDEFAGNPAQIAAAKEAREAAANPAYTAAMKQTTPDTKSLDRLLERPSMRSVLRRTEDLIAERGGTFAPLKDPKTGAFRPMSGEEAQAMKLAFDDVIKLAPKGGMDTAEVRAMQATRASYVKWMEAKFPDLAKGRAAYREGSVPVNEMEVGADLRDKLVPALRDDAKPRSAVFAGSVRDSANLVKDATGQPRFSGIEDVLTNRGLQNTENVLGDLARSDRNADMARKGSAAAPNAIDLATANLRDQTGGGLPNMLHRGVMLANAIISRMEGKVNAKLAAEMASEMMDPPKVGEALKAAAERAARNKLIAEEILKAQRPAAIGGSVMSSQGAQ